MNINRRFFIGGLASFASMGLGRAFAAVPGMFTAGRPRLVFGVVSDVHISLNQGGKKIKKGYDLSHLEKAFAYFRDQGADAVVIAGDMAHNGLVEELQAVAGAWYRIFPNDRAPDGRTVERIFVFGNHDWSGVKRGKSVYGAHPEIVAAHAIATDPRKAWESCFHEPWQEFFRKEVKGYSFVGAHWCKGREQDGDCQGRDEHFIAGLADRYAAIKGKIDPSIPFFHVQHPHPRGTVHGDVWGQDDGQTTAILSDFPNAISFSGHSHSSLLDEKFIWQGGFTSIGTATLRNVGAGNLSGGLPYGCENAAGRDKKLESEKVMPIFDRFQGKQGQLVRVFDDRVVISRRDFVTDVALADDVVVPLPVAKNRPFAFASRKSAATAPEFPAGAALSFGRVEAKRRGAKKQDPVQPCVEIGIPCANANPASRPMGYRVETQGVDDKPLAVGVIADSFRFAAADPRARGTTILRVALARLAPGTRTFSVRAYDSWGLLSSPLEGSFVVES
ncbi:MAG: metallophosphoesterase [Kiritimatiellae bacterium]|nr:metallophosphoesterase [Kiritimatiellia bacterium]